MRDVRPIRSTKVADTVWLVLTATAFLGYLAWSPPWPLAVSVVVFAVAIGCAAFRSRSVTPRHGGTHRRTT